ncbi:hypothetical protein SAMN05421847_2768 [Halpernia humi]|uniref:Uncharacterized protein n=1 Tax=Halpernia humi TaxID=493375 RepID=A0A1H6B6N8_9FLAO|nr:hypothetical protein [Halpernia humi]SEG56509.1 hypothetical protein SAMN05421847_2768 [Halpernia humi]
MEWNTNLGLSIINILMLSICVMLFKKRTVLGEYFYYMMAAMGLTYVIDLVTFIIRCSSINNIYILYIYIYGGLGLFFLIIFLMYQNLIKDRLLKKISTFITVLFLILYFYKIFTIKISNGFPDIILFINVFLLIFGISLFLLDTFKTDLILEISHYYPFWFSLGLIIIYLGVVPSIFISKIVSSKNSLNLWSFIVFLVNLAGYGTLLIGLFKAKKLDK